MDVFVVGFLLFVAKYSLLMWLNLVLMSRKTMTKKLSAKKSRIQSSCPPSMLTESQVKFRVPQNVSAFCKTAEEAGDLKQGNNMSPFSSSGAFQVSQRSQTDLKKSLFTRFLS